MSATVARVVPHERRDSAMVALRLTFARAPAAMRFGEASEQERLRRLQGLRAELADAETLDAVAQVIRDVGAMLLGADARLRLLDHPIAQTVIDGTPCWRPDAATCVLPLLAGDRVVGAVDFLFETDCMFDEVERGFLTGIAQLVAEAVDRVLPEKRLRVLVVENDPATASVIGEALEALGHEAVVVYNERAALRAAEEFDAHVAIVDVGHIEATALATRLRSVQGWQSTRFVALVDDEPDARGFDHALVKPVPFDELAALLV